MEDEYKWTFWSAVRQAFFKNRLGTISLAIFVFLSLIGLYAPLLASSKPLVVIYDKHLYFPLFRYLFYHGFYTKPIDLFFNIGMITLPLACIAWMLGGKQKKTYLGCIMGCHIAFFALLLCNIVHDPASNRELTAERTEILAKQRTFREDPLLAPFAKSPDFAFDLAYTTAYGKLNLLLKERQKKIQASRLSRFATVYLEKTGREIPTLLEVERRREEEEMTRLNTVLTSLKSDYEATVHVLPGQVAAYSPFSHNYLMGNQELPPEAVASRQELEKTRAVIARYKEAEGHLSYLTARRQWLDDESSKLHVFSLAMRPFHWEDDAGGAQEMNQVLPWWELTRINRKDLVSGLLFGIRISLIVGVTAITLALLIGIPLGVVAGYFGGKTDIIICRIIEVWEGMPTFFMLLLIVAITESKSLFLVISVLGIFGWTHFARYIRGEVLRQKNLSYVTAALSLGFSHPRIMFSQILPNAIPPILTLLPFAMMAAISSEAGLSFLGLGEEGSTSWGVLMSEGRSVFPGESYLLWPPAIFLTILLVAIAIVGDALRDALDPKMRS